MKTAFPRLLIVLFGILGASFYYSMALVNIAFYLLALIGIVLFLFSDKEERRAIIRQLLASHTLKIFLVWVVLLYASMFYSSNHEMMMTYAGKYKKFIFLFFILYIAVYFTRRKIDLSRCFLIGLIAGGVALFALAVAGKLIGMEGEQFRYGYWVPSGYFITSLLFSIVAVIGVVLLSQKRWVSGALLLLIGLFEVFYVMQQRTAYITLLLALLYLIWVLPIGKLRYKVGFFTVIVLATIITMMTQNPVSNRMNYAFSEVERCYTTLHQTTKDIDDIVNHCRSSNGIRLFFYTQAIEQIQSSWLYGHGLGGLNLVTAIKADDQHLKPAGNPHNEYLLQGVQLGVIGMGLLLALFIFAYREAWALSSNRRYIFTSIVLMYALSCLFNSFLLDASEGILFIMICIAIMNQYTQERQNHETHYS